MSLLDSSLSDLDPRILLVSVCVFRSRCLVRSPWPFSLASPEGFKLGRVAPAGPEWKPERDSRGHGYSWRDLVQRICNLHFKHALKSVPGRQPRSALTLVAGGPCWCSDIFSFKTEHKRARTHMNTHTCTGSGSFYGSPLTDPSLPLHSLRGSVFMFATSVQVSRLSHGVVY